MAREITVLSKQTQNGTVKWRTIFYYDISADPVVDDSDVKIATQAVTNLPAGSAQYFTSAEQTAINDGDAGFETRTLEQEGETTAAFVTRAGAIYTARKAFWLAREKAIHENTGLKVDV